MSPELAIFGNLAVDDIVYPDGRTRMGQAGGAVIYVALGASLWGIEVGVVSRAGTSYPTSMLDALADRQIDLDGLARIDGPGLRTWLLYEGELRRVVHRLDVTSHLEASPGAGDLPSRWSPDYIHIAPLPLDVQADLVTAFCTAPGTRLSLDPYELISNQRLETWREIAARLECLFCSEDELADARWRRDPDSLVTRLENSRLRWMFFKRGSSGGIGFDIEKRDRFAWHGQAEAVVDSTGAGDAFAGGTLAGLIRGEKAALAIRRGVVSASFALQARGAEGLLAASPDAAELRLDSWFPG